MSHTQSRDERSESTAARSMVNVASADQARLARLHGAALGWEVTHSDDDYGMVEGNGIKIGFGKVEGFRPARWPDEAGAKRFHLDRQVDDFDEATERLCVLGAGRADFPTGAGGWPVLLDPDRQRFHLSPCPVTTL